MNPDPFVVHARATDVPGIHDTGWINLTEGIVIFTGRNNAGKSRLLRSIASVSHSVTAADREASAELQVRYSDVWFELKLESDRVLSKFVYRQAGMQHEAHWQDSGAGYLLNVIPGSAVGHPSTNGRPPSLEDTQMPLHIEVQDALSRLIYLPPYRVVGAQGRTDVALVPAPNADDLGQVIFTHLNKGTAEFDVLFAEMCSMFPEIERILTIPTGGNGFELSIRDRFLGQVVPINRTGTGVAQILHLLASVLFMPPGRIFLIDEPHTYLHPGVERLLVRFLRRHPEHFYVCATHSPVFINAASPEAVWLVTRSIHGTSVRSVFRERLTRAHIFDELGIDVSDVALMEKVLFVEGPTEEQVLPIMLEKLGWNPAILNCAIVQMHGGDIAGHVDHMVHRLSKALGVDFQICLDGDKNSDHTGHKRVCYLPVPEIEDVFLLQPEAILHGLCDALGAQAPDEQRLPPPEWTIEHVERFISKYQEIKKIEGKPIKASQLISKLAFDMGLEYSKPTHGAMIAGYLASDTVEVLRETFQPFFESAVRSISVEAPR